MTPLLSAVGVNKSYRRQSLVRRHTPKQVLRDIDLQIAADESLAILGRSGSGKSTLVRQLLGIETPDSGSIRFDGRDLRMLDAAGWHDFRRSVQMVFQDSVGAVSPRQTIQEIISEPLRHLTALSFAQQRDRGPELLASVALLPSDASKRPGQMSGGQLQRVCIARALATDPRLLILDEAVSNLDLRLQHQIIKLIRELRTKTGAAVIFITHDLRLVRLLCERVIVLDDGQVVEQGLVGETLALESIEGRGLQGAILPAFPATAVLNVSGA